MSVFVIASVRGAPGATTTARLVAGSMASGVVVEADLNGGTLASQHRLGREPGLTTRAAARTTASDAWRDHAQLADGVPVLVGADDPTRAIALWSRAGPHLARVLSGTAADVVVDAGRLDPDGPLRPVLSVAAVIAAMVRPEAEDLVALSHRLPMLREHSATVGVILVGGGTYWPRDVTEQLGVEILATLPSDLRSSVVLARSRGAPGRLVANELAGSMRSLAKALTARGSSGAADPGGEPHEVAARTGVPG